MRSFSLLMINAIIFLSTSVLAQPIRLPEPIGRIVTASPCQECTTCDKDYADRHGTDTPSDYAKEKTLFKDVFNDVVATNNVSNWPQARSVWYALGERFRKNTFGPEDYIANCTSCKCKKTEWCTEFVISAYKKAGMDVDGANSDNPVSSSRALFRCAYNKHNSSKIFFRGRTDSSFIPRPGDALVFQWGTTGSNRPDDGTYNGVDCKVTWDTVNDMEKAGKCSDHTGMVLGVSGQDLYTVEGNVSKGRVRIKKYVDFKNNTNIVGFVRINSTALDCKNLP